MVELNGVMMGTLQRYGILPAQMHNGVLIYRGYITVNPVDSMHKSQSFGVFFKSQNDMDKLVGILEKHKPKKVTKNKKVPSERKTKKRPKKVKK